MRIAGGSPSRKERRAKARRVSSMVALPSRRAALSEAPDCRHPRRRAWALEARGAFRRPEARPRWPARASRFPALGGTTNPSTRRGAASTPGPRAPAAAACRDRGPSPPSDSSHRRIRCRAHRRRPAPDARRRGRSDRRRSRPGSLSDIPSPPAHRAPAARSRYRSRSP